MYLLKIFIIGVSVLKVFSSLQEDLTNLGVRGFVTSKTGYINTTSANITWSTGHHYYGEVRNGVPWGEGTMTYPPRVIYR